MWHTIGHERAVNALKRSLQEGRVSHAYLIVGPRQVGKMTLALDLARMVNCLGKDQPCGECGQCRRIDGGLHSDVRVVALETQKGADGRTRALIGIDQVREVQREASLKPFEGRYRVFIFDGAEHLSEEASNSLLKILEEPPEQVILALLAAEAEALLPTIVSRCQRLELKPLPTSLIAQELQARFGVDAEKAQELARLSAGRPGWALQAVSQPEMLELRAQRLAAIEALVRGGLDERFSYAETLASSFAQSRDSTRQELELWLEWWRDVLVIKEGVPQYVTNLSRMDALRTAADALSSAQIASAIKAIGEAAEHLERNVNSRLALEGLMLAIPRP